ncbi:uncharacterized protein PAC_14991 [Phialocephala subalpina]|uniref:Class II aldolase/adducin N-terminal domain-containing protein n=1 Tax=Phialocephala subalpina TaxID=576137 RepID=A0A1L7XJ78_9HELO|nr:uncharacterized protein PAC_14991 [Phialocephala subalpina]
MSASTSANLPHELPRRLISACHILHFHHILDAYGHISVRHPQKHNVFIMSRNIAPAIISSAGDLIEYYVNDASPVESTAAVGYVERYIHISQVRYILDAAPDFLSSMLIFRIEVPLRSCFHMAGFLGTSTPIFDISEYYKSDDTKDMLVRSTYLGEALASCFANSGYSDTDNLSVPLHNVVLMRSHGLTVVASSIEECVFRAIYTQKNAMIQTAALNISAAYLGSSDGGYSIRYLDQEEAAASTSMTQWSVMRPWKLWLREVEESGLYVNHE